MYSVGDYVVKLGKGVCKVEDITSVDMPGADKNRLYYLLLPLEEKNAKLYVPVEMSEKKLRPVITREAAWRLIGHMDDILTLSVTDERQRENMYKDALQSCEPERIVAVLKTIYQRKNMRNTQGKKITTVDDKYFKLAEDVLHSELAFAIGREKQEMYQVISENVGRL